MSTFTLSIIIALSLGFVAVKAFQRQPDVCPPGWLAWHYSCYILLPDRMNWFQASKLCDQPDSTLVIPDSKEEHDFIWQGMKAWVKESGAANQNKFEVWIGCQDPDNKRDGLVCLGKEENPTYTNWRHTEPSTINETCVRMAGKFDGEWGDIYCSFVHFVACEMRLSRRDYCLQSDADGRFTAQCLLNHHIKNLRNTGVTGCGQACWAEPRCHSFNLWQQVNKMEICQLNNATRLEADVTDFKEVENCSLFEL